MMQILGWLCNVVFLIGAWFMGHKTSQKTRSLGILLTSICNIGYVIQSIVYQNYSLLFLCAAGAILQFRAFLNWRKGD